MDAPTNDGAVTTNAAELRGRFTPLLSRDDAGRAITAWLAIDCAARTARMFCSAEQANAGSVQAFTVNPLFRGAALAGFLEMAETQQLLRAVCDKFSQGTLGDANEKDGEDDDDDDDDDEEDPLHQIMWALDELAGAPEALASEIEARRWLEDEPLASLWPAGHTGHDVLRTVRTQAEAEGFVIVGDVHAALDAKVRAAAGAQQALTVEQRTWIASFGHQLQTEDGAP